MNEQIAIVKKDIKKINTLFVWTIITTIILVIPIVPVIFVFPPFINCGLTILLYFMIRKHYDDINLKISVIIGIVQLLLTFGLNIFRSLPFSQFIIIFSILIIFLLAIVQIVMIFIARSTWSNNVIGFQYQIGEYPPGFATQYTTRIRPIASEIKPLETKKMMLLAAIKGLIAFVAYMAIMEVKYIGMAFFYPFFIFAQLTNMNSESYSTQAWLNVYIQVVMAIIFIAIFWQEIIYSFKSFKLTKTWLLPFFFGAGMFLTIVFNIILDALVGNSTSVNQQGLDAMQKAAPVALFIAAVILAPIVEELVFRRGFFEMIYSGIRLLGKETNYQIIEKVAAVSAILLTTFIFGFIHVMSNGDYIAILGYLGMSFAITMTYYLSNRNVLFTITMHITLNLLATLS